MMPTDYRLELTLDSLVLIAELFEEAAPQSTRSLLSQLPLEGQAMHAMWSGPLCIVEQVNLSDAPLENPVTFLGVGDLVYYPRHNEIAIAYGATQFREPTGSVYVTYLGRARGDLERLGDIGRRLQHTGAKRLVLKVVRT
jgi:hypothetical protein